MSIRLFRPSQHAAETSGEVHRDLYRWLVELVQTFNNLLAGTLPISGTGDADGNPGLEGVAKVGSNGAGVQGYGDGTGAGGYFEGGATGNGVTAIATGGVGVQATSSGNHAVIASGDATTPAKSALYIVPQDAEPTGPNAVGNIYVTSAGVLRICTAAGSPGTWVNVGSQ